MADKLNRVYVDGLTRFETGNNHRDTSLPPPATKETSGYLPEKYSKRKQEIQKIKRPDLEKYYEVGRSSNGLKGEKGKQGVEIGEKSIERGRQRYQEYDKGDKGAQGYKEKDHYTRSVDKLLGENYYLHKQKRLNDAAIQDLRNEYNYKPRQRLNTYNFPSQEPKYGKMYRDLYPADPTPKYDYDRFRDKQCPSKQDIHSKYPLPSSLVGEQYLAGRKEDILRRVSNQYEGKQKKYMENLMRNFNEKELGGREEFKKEWNPNLLRELEDKAKRDRSCGKHVVKEYDRDIGKEFKREILRDYSQQLPRNPNPKTDRQPFLRKEKEREREQMDRSPASYLNSKQYFREYCLFSKQGGIGVKPQNVFKNIGNNNQPGDYSNRMYQRQEKYSKVSPVRYNPYDQNNAHKGIKSTRQRERGGESGYRGLNWGGY